MELRYYRHNANEIAEPIEAQVIPFDELTVLLDGKMTYTADGEEISLSPADAIYLPAGTVRTRKRAAGCDYVSFNFISDRCIFPTGRIDHALNATLRHLIGGLDGIRATSVNLSDRRYSDLFDCFLLQIEADRVMRAESPLVKQIRAYIRAHLGEKITLEDIGRETFFSPVYCDRVFKRETGRSVIDYVIDCRLSEAQMLLADGGYDLHTVAEKVGFSDYNYFSRVFKSRLGIPPSKLQIKKRARKSAPEGQSV